MERRSRVGVAGLAWFVASSALFAAALAGDADRVGVATVAAVGLALWAVAAALEPPAEATGRDASGIVVGAMVAAGSVEAASGAIAGLGGQQDQRTWFYAAAAFAVAAALAARRHSPGDGAFAAQLLFHTPLIVPALFSLGTLTFVRGNDASTVGPAVRQGTIIACVGIYLGLALLLGVIAYGLATERGRGGAAWRMLMVAESAYSVIAVRWASDGI